jgi:hypothetical protein
VRPFGYDFLNPPGLDIGFLLGAVRDGKLKPASDPVTPSIENEMRIRLGIVQPSVPGASNAPSSTPARPTCSALQKSVDLNLSKGDQLVLTGSINVVALDGGEEASNVVRFNGSNGALVRVELDDLHVRVKPVGGAAYLCPVSDR